MEQIINGIFYYGSLALCIYVLVSAWVYALTEEVKEEETTTEN